MKKLFNLLLCLVLVGSLFSTLTFASSTKSSINNPIISENTAKNDLTPERLAAGKVIASALNVRTGPGTNYSVKASLKYGTAVYIYDISDGWYYIMTKDKNTYGWVCAKYVEVVCD